MGRSLPRHFYETLTPDFIPVLLQSLILLYLPLFSELLLRSIFLVFISPGQLESPRAASIVVTCDEDAFNLYTNEFLTLPSSGAGTSSQDLATCMPYTHSLHLLHPRIRHLSLTSQMPCFTSSMSRVTRRDVEIIPSLLRHAFKRCEDLF